MSSSGVLLLLHHPLSLLPGEKEWSIMLCMLWFTIGILILYLMDFAVYCMHGTCIAVCWCDLLCPIYHLLCCIFWYQPNSSLLSLWSQFLFSEISILTYFFCFFYFLFFFFCIIFSPKSGSLYSSEIKLSLSSVCILLVCLASAASMSSFLNWPETKLWFSLIISSERKLLVSLFIVSAEKLFSLLLIPATIVLVTILGLVVLSALCWLCASMSCFSFSNCSHFPPSIWIGLSHLLLSALSSTVPCLCVVSQLNDIRLSLHMYGMSNTAGPPSCHYKKITKFLFLIMH